MLQVSLKTATKQLNQQARDALVPSFIPCVSNVSLGFRELNNVIQGVVVMLLLLTLLLINIPTPVLTGAEDLTPHGLPSGEMVVGQLIGFLLQFQLPTTIKAR